MWSSSWGLLLVIYTQLQCVRPQASAHTDSNLTTFESVTFTDTLGANYRIDLHDGALQWCEGDDLTRCDSVVILKIEALHSNRVELTHGWLGAPVEVASESATSGQAYYELVAGIVKLADLAGVSVMGNASESLRILQRAGNGSGQLAIQANQTFPLPLYRDDDPFPSAHVKVLGDFSWLVHRMDKLCAAIVQTAEDCNSVAFLGPCTSYMAVPESKNKHFKDFLGFSLPRPSFVDRVSFTSGSADSGDVDHRLCLLIPDYSARPLQLGRIVYHPNPQPRWLGKDPETIAVRTFLNPGWRHVFQVECEDCGQLNRLVWRAVHIDYPCKTVEDQDAVIQRSAMHYRGWSETHQCFFPDRAPCDGYPDEDALAISKPLDDSELSRREWLHSKPGAVAFVVNASRRLASDVKERLLKHHSVLCFYPNVAYPEGRLIGFAAVENIGGRDFQAFIALVCFVPLLCTVTALVHINKQRKCEQHLSSLRHRLQREQLERELRGEAPSLPPMFRQGALPSRSQPSPTTARGMLSRMRDAVQGGLSSMVMPLIGGGSQQPGWARLLQ
mmetsp:Transcript_47792/g.87883  ORF Transcript_47792/g.87883 Transcript_47792/m.87883 type:complete len:558 (-) Transcript_47792:241-1914(-)